MDPLVVGCLGLVAAVFGLALIGFAYAQLEADPEQDVHMCLRSDIASDMGPHCEEWASVQNSKFARALSLVIAIAFSVSATAVSVWGFATAFT